MMVFIQCQINLQASPSITLTMCKNLFVTPSWSYTVFSFIVWSKIPNALGDNINILCFTAYIINLLVVSEISDMDIIPITY